MVNGAGSLTSDELRAALADLGLSVTEAAAWLGVARWTLYRYLRGDEAVSGPVSAAIRCRLAAAPATPLSRARPGATAGPAGP